MIFQVKPMEGREVCFHFEFQQPTLSENLIFPAQMQYSLLYIIHTPILNPKLPTLTTTACPMPQHQFSPSHV